MSSNTQSSPSPPAPPTSPVPPLPMSPVLPLPMSPVPPLPMNPVPPLPDIEMGAGTSIQSSNKSLSAGFCNAKGGCREEEHQHEWGKMILSYSFAGAIALLSIYFQIEPHKVPLSFYFLCFLLLLAFSTSLFGFSLRCKTTGKLKTTAKLLGRIGVVFAVLTVFIAIEIMLPWSLKWVVWVICCMSLCMLFVLHIYKCGCSPDGRAGSATEKTKAEAKINLTYDLKYCSGKQCPPSI